MKRVWKVDIHVGMNLLEQMHLEKVRKLAKASMDRALAGESFTEVHAQPGINTVYELSWSPVRQGNAVVGVASFTRDITAHRQAQEALQASESRFRSIFDNAHDGIAMADQETRRMVLANHAFAQMFACQDQDVVGRNVAEFHPPTARVSLERIFTGQTAHAHDLPARRRDGETFFVDVTRASATLDGRPMVVGFFRDMSESRAVQASLAQADRLSSMGMLAAGVAHEINNPLTYVLANVESLVEDLPPAADPAAGDPALLADAGERARVALGGIRRIKEIVRGLGTFSRVESDERTRVDLRNPMENAITMAFNEIKYRARLVKDLQQVPAVWATEGKLSQVFLNLLINACHAIPEGQVEANTIHVRIFTRDTNVVAEVQDSGSGITPENLGRIFEPFFTTKPPGKGSGLGLPICRKLVTEFGGDISVESRPGQGARFVVRLPACDPLAPEATPAGPRPPASGPRRILLVDDEGALLQSLSRMLGREHTVVTAASAQQAQAILEEDPTFDLVLCDVMMPGTDGVDLHRWIQSHAPVLATQWVFMTGGVSSSRTTEHLVRSGCPRLEKPFTRAEFDQVLLLLPRAGG
jgi:PAS domain S-box-containing protein